MHETPAPRRASAHPLVGVEWGCQEHQAGSTMNCASCGHENPDRANFCLECGDRFAARCGSCGTDLPARAKFCLECGTPTAARTDGERADGNRTRVGELERLAATPTSHRVVSFVSRNKATPFWHLDWFADRRDCEDFFLADTSFHCSGSRRNRTSRLHLTCFPTTGLQSAVRNTTQSVARVGVEPTNNITKV